MHSDPNHADIITTQLTWENLILPKPVIDQINEISSWFSNRPDHGARPSSGYKVLFYGSSGTGKTLTATLLGQRLNMPVYRLNLSKTVSKYIGETEKNLDLIFRQAEQANAILFFDEADALFGKASDIKTGKLENPEASYLLQRIEMFNGLVILASNFKDRIDEAFLRRFNQIIHFPLPDSTARLKLWQHILPQRFHVDKDIDWMAISVAYDITPAEITTAMKFALLRAQERKEPALMHEQVVNGIQYALSKRGKKFN